MSRYLLNGQTPRSAKRGAGCQARVGESPGHVPGERRRCLPASPPAGGQDPLVLAAGASLVFSSLSLPIPAKLVQLSILRG